MIQFTFDYTKKMKKRRKSEQTIWGDGIKRKKRVVIEKGG